MPPRRDLRSSCARSPASARPRDLARHAPLLRALGDETRLAMLAKLAVAPDAVCVCDLMDGLDLAQPTISHHLKILRDAGVVTSERRGTWIHYRLTHAALGALGELIAGLAPVPASPSLDTAESA